MTISLDEYLSATDETAVYPASSAGGLPALVYLALGLAGETGESVDVIKKAYRNGGDLTEDMSAKLKLELGDVLWYWVRLCSAAGFSFDDVMFANLDKLRARKDAGTLKVR